MKRIVFIMMGALAAVSGAGVCNSVPAAASAVTATPSAAEAALQEQMRALNEVISLLKTVNDAVSAQTAAPQVAAAVTAYEQAEHAWDRLEDALPKPEKKSLETLYEDKIDALEDEAEDLVKAIKRQDYYGCKELKRATKHID